MHGEGQSKKKSAGLITTAENDGLTHVFTFFLLFSCASRFFAFDACSFRIVLAPTDRNRHIELQLPFFRVSIQVFHSQACLTSLTLNTNELSVHTKSVLFERLEQRSILSNSWKNKDTRWSTAEIESSIIGTVVKDPVPEAIWTEVYCCAEQHFSRVETTLIIPFSRRPLSASHSANIQANRCV